MTKPITTPAYRDHLMVDTLALSKRMTVDGYLRLNQQKSSKDGSVGVMDLHKLQLSWERPVERKPEPHTEGIRAVHGTLDIDKLFMVSREVRAGERLESARKGFNEDFREQHRLKYELSPMTVHRGDPHEITKSIKDFLVGMVRSKEFFVYSVKNWKRRVVSIQRCTRSLLREKHNRISQLVELWRKTEEKQKKIYHATVQEQLKSTVRGKTNTRQLTQCYVDQYRIDDDMKWKCVQGFYEERWVQLRVKVKSWLATHQGQEKKLSTVKASLRTSIHKASSAMETSTLTASLNDVMWQIRALRITAPKLLFETSYLPLKELLIIAGKIRLDSGLNLPKEKERVTVSSIIRANGKRRAKTFLNEDAHVCENCLQCLHNQSLASLRTPVKRRLHELLQFSRKSLSPVPTLPALKSPSMKTSSPPPSPFSDPKQWVTPSPSPLFTTSHKGKFKDLLESLEAEQ